MKYELDFDHAIGDIVYHRYGKDAIRKAKVHSLGAEISTNVVLNYNVCDMDNHNFVTLRGFDLYTSPGKAFE